MASVPNGKSHGAMLTQIKGMTPSLLNLPEGCKFSPRCPRADQACEIEPTLDQSGPQRGVRCHHPHSEMTKEVSPL